MNTSNILSILSLLGIGTALGTYLRILWERKNNVQSQKQDYKTIRYKAIIVLMYGLLNFDKEKDKLNTHGRNFQVRQDLIDELDTEMYNMLLYASDTVVKATKVFITNPTKHTFLSVAIEMRKDMWGGKINLKVEDISL